MATKSGTATRKPGVLPIDPAQSQAQNNGDANNKSTKGQSSAAQDGVKTKIRLLPPGLTEDEFVNILGDEWKVGKGKVRWFRFTAGRIPKGASKDPVPGWAQFQVKEEDLEELDQAVRSAAWEDAKGTHNTVRFTGPPYVERAIYKKVPNTKSRRDPKEGTIDQDPEWQKFLVSLTQDPEGKKAESDSAADEPNVAEPAARSHITPLVAHILESKANKAKEKEAANAKSRKHTRHDSLGKGKAIATTASADEPKKKSRDKADKPNANVKILKKQAATEAAAEAAKAVAKDLKASTSTAEGPSNRRRVGAITDILKRDLGLAGQPSRKSRQDARQEAAAPKPADVEVKPKDNKGKANGTILAVASASSKTEAGSSTPTASNPPVEKPTRSSRRRGGKDAKANGGSSEAPAPAPFKPLAILQKKKEDVPSTPVPTTAKDPTPASKVINKPAANAAASTPPTGPKVGNVKGNQTANSQKKANGPPNIIASSTRAFLKHANPSQGVTEALLKEAMGAYGRVSSVEIDRRKGFAYVDFADHSGLSKALAASPVRVANAAVQVLERKDQTPKKAVLTSSPSIAAPKPKDIAPPDTQSIATAPAVKAPLPTPNAEKINTADQQPAKRSRRRGRGKGGNNGSAGNEATKLSDEGGPPDGAGSSDSAAAAVHGDAASAG